MFQNIFISRGKQQTQCIYTRYNFPQQSTCNTLKRSPLMSENTTHESPPTKTRGYLNHEFRLFHLRGQMDTPVAYHYHDFHKVPDPVKWRSGLHRGRPFLPPPPARHRPRRRALPAQAGRAIPQPIWRRIILYLSPECLDAFSCADCALDLCFQLAREQQSDVLRLGSLTMTPLLEALSRLENAYRAGGTNDNGTDNANFESLGGSSYGSGLLLRLLFLEFMVHLDRAASENHREYVPTSFRRKILELMRYLSEHPEEDHTIDQLAARFYISKYHIDASLPPGNRLHHYRIPDRKTPPKRKRAPAPGHPVTEACYQSGFRNYAAFLRAYKKKYRDTPHNLSRLNYKENFYYIIRKPPYSSLRNF